MRQVAAVAHPIETVGGSPRRAGAARCEKAAPTPPRAGHPTPQKKEAKMFRHPSARIFRPSAGVFLFGGRAGFGRVAGPGFRGAGVRGGDA